MKKTFCIGAALGDLRKLMEGGIVGGVGEEGRVGRKLKQKLLNEILG